MIDLTPSIVNPTLPLESETHITKVDETLVNQVVDLIPYSVDLILPLESESIPLRFFLLPQILLHMGVFHLFPLNILQVMRSFPFIGVD